MTRKISKLVAVCVAIGLASQAMGQAKETQSSWGSDRIAAAQKVVESVRDIGSWVGSRPKPLGEFEYAETRAFDMQLHESLKADLSPVNVRVNRAFRRGAMPARMGQWLRTIERSGGDVRTCVVDDGGKSFLALAAMLFKVVKKADKWVLYRPARNYDATIIVDPGKSEVMNIIFNERGTTSDCPQGTEAYRG